MDPVTLIFSIVALLIGAALGWLIGSRKGGQDELEIQAGDKGTWRCADRNCHAEGQCREFRQADITHEPGARGIADTV